MAVLSMQVMLHSCYNLVLNVGMEAPVDPSRVYLNPSTMYSTKGDHACFSLALEQQSIGKQYIVTPLLTALSTAVDDLLPDRSIRSLLTD